MAIEARSEIDLIRDEIKAKRERLYALQREIEPEPVDDYEFVESTGETVRLSELFGPKDDLIVIHNMGKSCSYCTMWADGFVGLHDHLRDRAAFVISSPDTPAVQHEFRNSRGWPFRMVSAAESEFTKDMGYQGNDGYWPGVSAFHRSADGLMMRTAHDSFGPYDEYNAAWNLFSLLEGGAGDWEPNFSYE